MATNRPNPLVNQSLARLHQIQKGLEDADRLEATALAEVKKTKGGKQRGTEVRETFSRARLELYNERALIEGRLLASGTPMPESFDEKAIRRLAGNLNLAEKLRNQRVAEAKHETAAGAGFQAGLFGCLTNCTLCVTSCTQCVTSCVTCVTLSGQTHCTYGMFTNNPEKPPSQQ